jgi:hypothetical protein
VTTPADELRTAAFLLRNPIRRPELSAVADLDFTEPLAAWLELEADVIAARQAQPEGAEWAVDIGGDHALTVARAINGGEQR